MKKNNKKKRNKKKNNNNLTIIGILLIFFSVVLIIYAMAKTINISNSTTIPNDYIVVFNGGVGEITNSTYIYKIDNGDINHGFTYINTKNTTVSYGSSEWSQKITDKGRVDNKDEIFEEAKKNNAYSFVSLPEVDVTYSIDDYKDMFLN